jgi:hypothetical protein
MGYDADEIMSVCSNFGYEAYLLTSQECDRSVVFLKNGLNLSAILGECTGFIFYLTDLNFTYLICFNDHDILIGAGAAIDWVKSKRT